MTLVGIFHRIEDLLNPLPQNIQLGMDQCIPYFLTLLFLHTSQLDIYRHTYFLLHPCLHRTKLTYYYYYDGISQSRLLK